LNQEKKYKKRTSFWPTIIGMTMVLFIVGFLGLITIFAKSLVASYQDNFELFVYFSDTTQKQDALKVESEIQKLDFVKGTTFVDRDIAARKEIKSLGDDFIKTLGYNPIPHSVKINIKSSYADQTKMDLIEKQLLGMEFVTDVNYAKDDLGKNLLAIINANFKRLELILLICAGVFLVICLILINITVRINMFARRFIIKSMQYVGASDWFIIKPFIGMYILYACISVVLSLGLLAGIVYLIENSINQNNWQLFLPQYSILAGFLLVLAILISVVSVFFATKRYLRLKIDQLY
jgi:cell division transport system permease protein